MYFKASLASLRVLAIIGQVGLVKLYTHYLLPAQLGEYYFFLAVSYFLNALIFVPVDYFQQAEVFKLRTSGHSLHGILRLNLQMLSLVCLVSGVVCAIFAVMRPALLSSVAIMLFLSVALYASTAVKNFLNNQGDQLLVVLMLVAEVPIRIVVFLELEKNGRGSSLSPLIATATSFVLVAGFVLLRVRKHWRSFTGAPLSFQIGRVVRFAAPTSFSAVMNWLQLQGYRLVLVPLGYAETVGLFAPTAAIGTSGMNGAATVYQQIYLPKIYQTAGKYLRSYLKGLALVILFVAFVGAVFRTQLVELVTNGRFVPYAWVLSYGVLIEAGNFVIAGLVVRLTIDDNTRAQIKANIFAVLLVPIVFAALFGLHMLSPFTLGLPLVLAQITVIGCIAFQSESRRWNQLKAKTDTMRSLS